MSLRRLVVALACIASVIVPPAGAVDEPDEDMPGRVVIIRPSSALFKFVSKAETEFALPDATNDPTVKGGSLEVFDAAGAQANVYPLPASGWKALGTPVQGYKYKGTGAPTDPCRVVSVKKRVVKAVCKGGGVTLTVPFNGEVGIVVTLGTDSKQYCARFGGVEARNDGTVLKRSHAPALALSCPVPGPTTTTLPFSCPSMMAPCGSCGAGFCSTHVDPDPPSPICADSAVCSPAACASDADCSGGQVCVQNPFPPGEIVCCSPCP